jgi:serine protease Do
MKRIGIIVALIVATCSGFVQAKSPADIYKNFSSSLAVVEYKLDLGDGPKDVFGPGVCVHIDTKGRAVFLTISFSIQTRLKDMTKLRVRHGGLNAREFPAEVMGVDPVTGLAFLRTTSAVKWTKVLFVGKQSGVKIGQQIVSIGLQSADNGYEPYLGVAYISGKIRAPETLYRVTGGKLTGVCSPVFNLDGKMVGIVARQFPTTFQMVTARGQAVVGLTGHDEKSYFLPIDEFSDTIASMPSPASVKRRVWAGVMQYHSVSKEDAKIKGINVPAVMLGKLVKGSPAAKAGLKERDLVIALDGRKLEGFPVPAFVGKQFLRRLQSIAAVGKKKVILTVKRGEETLSIPVQLVAIPKQIYEAQRCITTNLALIVREKVPSDSYVESSPTAEVKGLIVVAAPARGPAGAAGIRRGDLLIEVNGKSVTQIAMMKNAMVEAMKTPADKAIVLLVQRGEKTYPISVFRSQK